MKSTIVLSNPPSWWHTHGRKINVAELVLSPSPEQHVRLESSTADVLISTPKPDEWHVSWRILHGSIDGHLFEESNGLRIFSTEELLGAFGLNEFTGDDDLNQARNGHSSLPGKYIRAGRNLNIPCPGTACDGDPNISIWVEETIQEAISKLMEARAPVVA